MKKTSSKLALIAASAMAISTMGMGATPQAVPANNTTQSQTKNDAVERKIAPLKVERRDLLHPSGAFYNSNSRPPKEFGQWLQQTGRQKWNKR